MPAWPMQVTIYLYISSLVQKKKKKKKKVSLSVISRQFIASRLLRQMIKYRAVERNCARSASECH